MVFFGVSFQGVPGFLRHSHPTSLSVCEILVLENPLLKSEASLKIVQFSSRSSDLCSSASIRLQISLRKACFFAVMFQFGGIQSLWHFLALWSPYRLNVQVEFAVNKPIICPTVCTAHFL